MFARIYPDAFVTPTESSGETVSLADPRPMNGIATAGDGDALVCTRAVCRVALYVFRFATICFLY